jgi:anti-sigma regulatory factor (Ser/Thr protein kinase)
VRVSAVANTARALARPVAGSLMSSWSPGSPSPIATNVFVARSLESTPYWARRITKTFLQSCEISGEPAENALLLVSELTTNAVAANLAAGLPEGTPIWISLRRFPEGLLIEVHDSSPLPPIRTDSARLAEDGRGLMLVEALSRDWGYFPAATRGKIVYCLIGNLL